MDPTRHRNLIWLAARRPAGPRADQTNLATAWDVAVAQVAAAKRSGDLTGAARWEAKANRLYVEITGRRPG